MSEERHNF